MGSMQRTSLDLYRVPVWSRIASLSNRRMKSWHWYLKSSTKRVVVQDPCSTIVSLIDRREQSMGTDIAMITNCSGSNLVIYLSI